MNQTTSDAVSFNFTLGAATDLGCPLEDCPFKKLWPEDEPDIYGEDEKP